MSRISTPATIEDAPQGAQSTLNDVKAAVGMAPNLHRLMAHSPAALKAYVGMAGALSKGALDPKIGERIALATAQTNGCEYCLAAHGTIGKGAGLETAEIEAARRWSSSDAHAQAALTFAKAVLAEMGKVPGDAVEAARSSGLSEAELVEIVAHLGMNAMTNMVNSTFATEVDFPEMGPLAA